MPDKPGHLITTHAVGLASPIQSHTDFPQTLPREADLVPDSVEVKSDEVKLVNTREIFMGGQPVSLELGPNVLGRLEGGLAVTRHHAKVVHVNSVSDLPAAQGPRGVLV
jgi:hypothetical protein